MENINVKMIEEMMQEYVEYLYMQQDALLEHIQNMFDLDIIKSYIDYIDYNNELEDYVDLYTVLETILRDSTDEKMHVVQQAMVLKNNIKYLNVMLVDLKYFCTHLEQMKDHIIDGTDFDIPIMAF